MASPWESLASSSKAMATNPLRRGGKVRARCAGLPKGQKLATKFEGKELCFGYNNKDSCKGGCGRSHLCQICFAAHPMSSHSE